MNYNNYSIDLLSVILTFYAIRHIVWKFCSIFYQSEQVTGILTSKRSGFLNLFHWVTIERDEKRIELNISKYKIGLMSEGDHLQVFYQGFRITDFEIKKSSYCN